MKKRLIEGRYDSLTRRIVLDIFKFIKNGYLGSDLPMEFHLPKHINREESYTHESGLDFEVVLVLDRTNQLDEGGYVVNTFISYDDELVVNVFIDYDTGSEIYESLFYKISEDVRHEIEHYTQKLFNDRQQPKKDTATYDTTYEHHIDPSEIEALSHGFYYKAKKQKKPFDVVVWGDINSDVEKGNLTMDEAKDIFTRIISYARRRLPKAKYS